MQVTGRLIKWIDDKGFGFIQIENQDKQIFVHISAFPKYSGRPILNEKLQFKIVQGKQGKPQAVSVQLLDRKLSKPKRNHITKNEAKESNSLVGLIFFNHYYFCWRTRL